MQNIVENKIPIYLWLIFSKFQLPKELHFNFSLLYRYKMGNDFGIKMSNNYKVKTLLFHILRDRPNIEDTISPLLKEWRIYRQKNADFSSFLSHFRDKNEEAVRVAYSLLRSVLQSFPYYCNREVLIFDEIVKIFDDGWHKIGNIFLDGSDHIYGDCIRMINSSNLFHFTKAEYLHQILKFGRLFPSKVFESELLDYYSNDAIFRELFNEDISNPREKYIHESKFVCSLKEAWEEANRNLTECSPGIGDSKEIWENFVTSLDVPVINSFTESPFETLNFHCLEYGYYGIAFKKADLLQKNNDPNNSYSFPIRPVAYLDVLFSTTIHALVRETNRIWIEEMSAICPDKKQNFRKLRKNMMKDLYLMKPHHSSGFDPNNIYSTYFEREWRYISIRRPFEFVSSDIDFVVIPESEFIRHFDGIKNAISDIQGPNSQIFEVIKVCNEKKIKIRSLRER